MHHGGTERKVAPIKVLDSNAQEILKIISQLWTPPLQFIPLGDRSGIQQLGTHVKPPAKTG